MKNTIKEIIDMYESAIDNIEGLCYLDAYEVLNDLDLEDGICFYVTMRYKENKYKIIKYLDLENYGAYMFLPAIQVDTTEQIIHRCLKPRIQYLKIFL